MNEVDVQAKARAFIVGLDLSNIRSDLSVYAEKINAKIEYEELAQNESGYTLSRGGRHSININSLETEERQRFTICHEIAHVVLDLESSHEEVKPCSYVKRHTNEIWCDMFAAELLMPYQLFQKDVDDEEPSFDLIQRLANAYKTSFPATASRVAALSNKPCALVFMENGRVKYASRSTSLRNLNGWIDLKAPIPKGSAAWDVRTDKLWQSEVTEVSQDIWFSEWAQGSDLYEIARHYEKFDQTFSLIWFGEEDAPVVRAGSITRLLTEETDGLNELTGIIGWGKHR